MIQRNFRRILAPSFLLVSLFCLRFVAANACVLLPLPAVLDSCQDADVVVIARVVSIEKTEEQDDARLSLRIKRAGLSLSQFRLAGTSLLSMTISPARPS